MNHSQKLLKITFGTLAFVVILTVLLWQISKSRTFQLFGEIVPRVETKQRIVALTFDDGPTANTKAVLDELNKLGVRATFFVTGRELEENPQAGELIVAAGHELGNHSYSHQRMVLKTPSFFSREIEATDSLIRKAGYQGTINFRPPYGKKLFGLPYYLEQNQRKSIMWDIEPESIPEISGDSHKIVDFVLSNAKPGSIILLHVMYNSRQQSVDSIEGVVTGLKHKGFQFVTVSELLNS